MDTSDQATAGIGGPSNSARRMRTNEEKRQIVEEALAPGASVAAVARRHGVNANLLFGWRRLHKAGLLKQSREPAAAMLPVTVTAPTVMPERRVECTTPRASRPPRRAVATPAAGYVEIELPDGTRVRVHGRIERGALAEVLATLGRR